MLLLRTGLLNFYPFLQYITDDIDIMIREQSSLVSDYVEDILAWMKDKESSMVQLELLSPQLDRRRQLVDWTCSMAVKLKLTTQPVHLAVKLLDHFMAGHDIEVTIQ